MARPRAPPSQAPIPRSSRRLRSAPSNILAAAKALGEAFPASKSLARLVTRGQQKIESIASLGEIEDYLRDVSGMSRTAAKALLSHAKTLGQRDVDAGGLQQIADALKRRGELQGLGPRDADDGLHQIAEALKRRGQLLAA